VAKNGLVPKRFIAVIGVGRSGKSTIIQSLTGCKSHNFRDFVIDESTRRTIYVHAGSPQEQHRYNRTDLPEFRRQLRKVLRNRAAQGAVYAIQPTDPSKRLSLEEMFEEVAKDGLFETHVFILNPPRNEARKRDSESLTKLLDRVKSCKVDVRNIHILDARRFAILNADAIRSISGVPY
jgi:energy-coupling factor transporter ATP-binding protein EcfA2